MAALLYNAGLWASLPPGGPPPPPGVLVAPDTAIAEASAPGGRLPLLTLPSRRAPPKRIRSFGDLGAAAVVPLSVGFGGGSAPSAAGAADDADAAVVPHDAAADADGDTPLPDAADAEDEYAGMGGLSRAASAELLSSASTDDLDELGGGRPAAPPAPARAHRPLRGSRSAASILPCRTAGPPGAAPSLIDRVVLAEWAARAAAGLFRYGVAGVPTKVVPGPYGFVASFNEGRLSKKRPTEFSAEAVVQAFDPARFNFQKAPQREVLAALAADGAPGTPAAWTPDAPAGPDPSLLLINVSPIEYGHVLLIPRVMAGLPQLIDPASMALALRFAAEADNPYLRLCYNSLGAYGTVNHLHFQAYFLGTPFPVEVAPCGPLPGEAGSRSAAAGYSGRPGAHGARVRATAGYPARAIIFEAARGDLGALANAIAGAAARLAAANVPHNLFVVDCGQRAFLFPNRFGDAKAGGRVPEDLLETAVDPACFELAGHMVFKRACDFEAASEGGVWRLLAAASPSEEDFAAICDLALGPVEE